jgi:hypothetical protein
VHLRRAILLFALVLGLTALAAAVSPVPRDENKPATPGTPVGPAGSVLPRAIAFTSLGGGRPQVRRARPGEHLLVTVASAQGGLVTIPALGRTESVSEAAPARFDLLAPEAGRYDVMLSLGGGGEEPRRVGTLVTRP